MDPTAFAVFRSLVENLLSQIQMHETSEVGERLKRSLAQCSRGFEHLLVTINPEFLNYIVEQNFTKSNLDAESLLTNYSVLLVELAKEENGLVFFIDDIQWADSNSMSLIRRMIEMTSDLPIFFLFTGRNNPESIQDLNIFEQTVSSQRLVRYTLQPLSRLACSSIIRNHLGNLEVEKSLEEKLIEYSSGNPFLLIENLNRLASSGYLFIENNKWRV